MGHQEMEKKMMRKAWIGLGICLLTALVCSGCVMKSTYEEDTGRLSGIISDLEGKNKRLGSDQERLQKAHDQCLSDLSQLSEEKGALSGDLQQALSNLEEMRKLAEKREAMLASIVSSLQSVVSAGHVRVVQRNGKLIVEIEEDILFSTGKSRVKEEGKVALAALAPVLAGVNREFQVTGHTDDQGEEEKNWELSLDRALSVLVELVRNGYPSKRISAAGYAYFQPIADNESDEGKQRNRRVDIVLVPDLEELKLPSLSKACGQYIDLAVVTTP